MSDVTITSADGTQLAARCGGRGTPLVLVHGAMSDIDDFASVEDQLAERHTVWVYSRRGRGGSDDGAGYGLDREIEDVLAVLGAAGDDAHLLGHSGGAYYCLLAASRAPSLRSLTLYEPPLHLDRWDPAFLDEMESALEAGDPDRALEIFFPLADIDEHELAALRAEEPAWKAAREGVGVFPREYRALLADGSGLLSEMGPLGVPTLYLFGEDSTAPVYPALDEVAELLPKAQFHCLPGQRHVGFVFDPATFVRAVLGFTTAHDA